MGLVVNDFVPGETKIQFVPYQVDLNGNPTYDDKILALHSAGPMYGTTGDEAINFDEGYLVDTPSPGSNAGFNSSDSTFSLASDSALTIYVQALRQGTAEIELEEDPLGDGNWIPLDKVMFTCLDTNVGSPSGVSVTPAGYLAVNEDPLGVGSSVFMTSAEPTNPTLATPADPAGTATIGLPAHLVLTGNGVAVINNDQIDIWDYDYTTTTTDPSPHWILVPRKPQEQGTMVQEGDTFVQSLNGTQYTFAAPDPDDDASSSPRDFGLLTSMVDAYGNGTDYTYDGDQLTSQVSTVGPGTGGHPSQEQIAYTPGSDGLVENVTRGYGSGSGTSGHQDSAMQFDGSTNSRQPGPGPRARLHEDFGVFRVVLDE